MSHTANHHTKLYFSLFNLRTNGSPVSSINPDNSSNFSRVKIRHAEMHDGKAIHEAIP